MAEITLSDYVGYIFSEIVRARDIADRESKRIALIYAQDQIMQYFSVPRFKIPEMELTIPVLISGARFSTTVNFVMSKEDFKTFITGKLNNIIRSISLRKRDINFFVVDRRILGNEVKRILKAETSEGTIGEFYDLLATNQDPSEPENIIQEKWYEVFSQRIQEAKLVEEYKKHYPNNELFKQTLLEIIDKVKQNTIVSQTKITNLLVNPETNAVKNGSNEASVFIVKAKITEEGIFIKTIRDKDTGEEKQITEFE
jgi:hypothetical protein